MRRGRLDNAFSFVFPKRVILKRENSSGVVERCAMLKQDIFKGIFKFTGTRKLSIQVLRLVILVCKVAWPT